MTVVWEGVIVQYSSKKWKDRKREKKALANKEEY